MLPSGALEIRGLPAMAAKSKKRKTASPSKKNTKRKSQGGGRFWLRFFVVTVVLLFGALVYLDAWVQMAFSGKKWAIPAKVYARPLELYTGLPLSQEDLSAELKALGYRFNRSGSPNSVERSADTFRLFTRGFQFWDGTESARELEVRFYRDQVEAVYDRDGQPINIARLEPLQIGGIYPAHNEDRLLVRLDQLPVGLRQALLAVEDKHFYEHNGISVLSMLRAMWVNVRAGRWVQGGSTLTQQLVKNFFLTRERTLLRKGVEVIMALLLEFHYDKNEIFEAYVNEVYLAQSGPRAIHGFGLASQYYFNTPVENLRLAQYALLVALVKGPSYYDPWRHPERALKRRNLVIEQMADQGLVSAEEARKGKSQTLGIGKRTSRSRRNYPAYLDLVRRQLRRDYREQDLNSTGLQIFTNFDPLVQWRAEQSLNRVVNSLEKGYELPSEGPERLQGAVVVTGIENGEVLAVVGDREPRYAGFNRALDARRPVGSLIKPAVYLTALESPQQYTLATLLDDAPVSVQGADGSLWEPQNFDKKAHGEIPLHIALAQSYNQATARLGMTIGLDNVIDTLARLGVDQELQAVPSLLLGAVEMSPLEVSVMYQTIAASGFHSPLRAIREVMDGQAQPLRRYPLEVEQKFTGDVIHLLQYGLLEVMREGTGRSVYNGMPATLNVAGKTGTSDEQRDSWFAGFGGDHLAVAWVGRDDNGETPLTGSSGALPVWRRLIAGLNERSVVFSRPAGVEYHWIDDKTGLLSKEACQGARYLPFIAGSQPIQQAPCNKRRGRIVDWLRYWFQN